MGCVFSKPDVPGTEREYAASNEKRKISPSTASHHPRVTADVVDTWINGCKTILRLFETTLDSVPVPGLKGAIGGILMVIDLFDITDQNKKDLHELLEYVKKLDDILRPYKESTDLKIPEELRSRIASAFEDLQQVQEQVQEALSHGKFRRVVDASSDTQLFTTLYRRVKYSIEQLTTGSAAHTEAIVWTNLKLAELGLLDKLPLAVTARWDDLEISECLEGTRTTVLNEVRNWMSNPREHQVFWLNGLAGTGKSTVAKSIAHFAADFGQLGGSFFCSRSESDRSDLKYIFPTLAFHLSERFPKFRAELIKVIQNRRDIGYSLPVIQVQRLIVEPLQKSGFSQQAQPIILIIEALDECKDELFATSRPEPAARDAFADDMLKGHSNVFELHLVDRQLTDQDIRRYLTIRLQEIARKGPDEDWPPQNLVDGLVKKASGLFIYASTLCKFIDPYGDIQQQLEEIAQLSDSDHEGRWGIDELYQKVLDSAIVRLSDKQVAERQSLLGTVIFLRNPLSPQDLSHLTGWTLPHVIGLLSRFHSLLAISSNEEAVRPIHASFQDFLTNKDRCSDPRLLVQPSVQHTEIALLLFKRMTNLKKNICDIESFKSNREVEDLPARQKKAIDGSLMYACRYWAEHLADAQPNGGPSEELVTALDNFARHGLLFWIETMSILGSMNMAVSCLRIARLWASGLSKPRPDLTELLTDGYRTILEFFDAIKDTASQVYVSALSLVPKDILLRQVYQHEMSDVIRVIRGTDNKWSPCLRTMGGTDSLVVAAAFSPDKVHVASASTDKSIRIWDARTGELRWGFEDMEHAINSVAFLPNTDVVCGFNDMSVIVWHLETGQVKRLLKGYVVRCLPAGNMCVAQVEDNTTELWDIETGKLQRTSRKISSIYSHQHPANIGVVWDGDFPLPNDLDALLKGAVSSTVSQDKTLVAVGTSHSTVEVWDLKEGKLKTICNARPPDWILSVDFAPDSKHIVATGGSIYIWDLNTGELKASLYGHTAQVNSIAFSIDGTHLVTASDDRTTRIWEVDLANIEKYAMEEHPGWVHAVTFTQDGLLVGSGSWNRTVSTWDSNTGVLIKLLRIRHDVPIMTTAFSPDGQLVIAGDRAGGITSWNSITGQQLAFTPSCLPDHEKDSWTFHCSASAISADKALVAFAMEYDLTIYDMTTWKNVAGASLHDSKSLIQNLLFSPSGKKIAVGCGTELYIASRSDEHNGPPMKLALYDCKNKMVRFSGEKILLASGDRRLEQLRWSTDVLGNEELVLLHESDNAYYMHKGWIRDETGKKHCWVPDIYRGHDICASWGNKLAMSGGSGHIVILEINSSAS